MGIAVIAVLMHFCAISASAQPSNPLTITEVEDRAITARRAILNMELSAKIAGWSNAGETNKDDWSSTRKYWRKGERRRVDYTVPDGVRRTECRNCDKIGWGIDAVHQKNYVVEVFKLGSRGRLEMTTCSDPILIGFYPEIVGMHYVASLNSIIGRADRTEPTIKTELYEGENCYRINYTSKSNVEVDVWINPARGYNIVRIDVNGSKPNHQSARMEVVPVGKSGVWFPKTVTLDRREGDK